MLHARVPEVPPKSFETLAEAMNWAKAQAQTVANRWQSEGKKPELVNCRWAVTNDKGKPVLDGIAMPSMSSAPSVSLR